MTDFAKVKLSGSIFLKSGLHIGTGSSFAAIGAIDSPVIRDSSTKLPLIPGSSLKGKMRSLLAKGLNQRIASNPEEDNIRITRLFGATRGNLLNDGIIPARLIFRDCLFINQRELEEKGVQSLTETKFENAIDRTTMIANPRQIERVIPGSKFSFEIIYNVEDRDDFEEDIDTILKGLHLLEMDYLGGSGSRGYGQIKFNDLKVETVFGQCDIDQVSKKLEEKAWN